jgi:hypothetical protein
MAALALKSAEVPFCVMDHPASNGTRADDYSLDPWMVEPGTAGPYLFNLICMAAPVHARWLLQDGTRDTGCGLKAFRRDAFLALPYFNHMHRYLPALFARDGWQVAHVDVSHRPRGAGASNYSNLQRAMVGAVDLLGVAWLLRRRKKAKPLPEEPHV